MRVHTLLRVASLVLLTTMCYFTTVSIVHLNELVFELVDCVTKQQKEIMLLQQHEHTVDKVDLDPFTLNPEKDI